MSDLPDLPQYSEPTRGRGRRPLFVTVLLLVALGVAGWLLFRPQEEVDRTPDPAHVAQSMLRDSLVAAGDYFDQNDTMLGFSATRAHRTLPFITFNRTATASEGQVSIRDVGPSTVVLVTLDAEGTAWCAAHSVLGDSVGRGDVATASECAGGW